MYAIELTVVGKPDVIGTGSIHLAVAVPPTVFTLDGHLTTPYDTTNIHVA